MTVTDVVLIAAAALLALWAIGSLLWTLDVRATPTPEPLPLRCAVCHAPVTLPCSAVTIVTNYHRGRKNFGYHAAACADCVAIFDHAERVA